MREITFRGKRVDNEEWVYGFLTRMWGKYHIIDENNENVAYEIIPGTVGQYTGVKDKNGEKVFEGDIVRYETIARNGYDGIYKVVFEDRNGCGYFGIAYSNIETCFFCYSTPASQMEVIGNIYDNKEILEGKE